MNAPHVEAPDDDARRRAWETARAESLAATALLDDPSVAPWTAAVHLRRGYVALSQATGSAATTLDAIDLDASDGVSQWIVAPKELAGPLRALTTDDDAAIDRTALHRLAEALGAAITAAGDARFDPDRRARARRRTAKRWGLGVVLAIPIVAAALWTMPDFREGPWRAQWYANVDFAGEPVATTREGDVRFDWSRGSPSPTLPRDAFSVRFDTCLVLDEPLTITFQLVSDDGSRVFVDGEKVVDDWGVHAKQSAGGDVELAAGVHHLRVDYFEERALASLELRASLRGEVPATVPARLLRHPAREIEHDPCADD